MCIFVLLVLMFFALYVCIHKLSILWIDDFRNFRFQKWSILEVVGLIIAILIIEFLYKHIHDNKLSNWQKQRKSVFKLKAFVPKTLNQFIIHIYNINLTDNIKQKKTLTTLFTVHIHGFQENLLKRPRINP